MWRGEPEKTCGKGCVENPFLWGLPGITTGCNYTHQLLRTSTLSENLRKLSPLEKQQQKRSECMLRAQNILM